MKLEVNLVSVKSPFTRVYGFLARNRYDVENDSDVASSIIKFIHENIDYFSSAISDKNLISKLETLNSINPDQFMSLKYILCSFGLDILVTSVGVNEINPESVSDNEFEYSIIDDNMPTGEFTKQSTKYVLPSDNVSMSTLYTKIMESFELFKGDLLSDYKNPLQNQIDVIRANELSIGETSPQITSYINSVFEYLGKKLILITQ